jgi:general secretion pathway protein J
VRGFTLIELLVAMTILSLFLTVSLGAVRTGSRSLEAAHGRASASHQLRVSADFLRRQLARVSAQTWSDGGDERLALVGERDRLTFIAPAPRFSPGAGLFVYTLAAEREGHTYALTLSHAPFDPGQERFGRPEAAVRLTLASGFDAVALEYYGSETEDDEPAWLPAWRRDAERFPLAVRLRAARGGGRDWPVLVFDLRSAEASG